jgi:hypothetical protein
MQLTSMMHALTACAVAVSCAFAPCAASAQNMLSPQQAATQRMSANAAKKHIADKPFAFRGIPLGITLDEFRAVSRVRATPPGSVPVCETDNVAGSLGMRLKTSESLTIACQWAHRVADGWEVSRAVVDGAPADEHVLRFVRVDGRSAFRLYEISFVIGEITADDLRDAFEDRYGAPRTATQVASTTAGALPVYIWENDVSSITLCLLPATHNATLTYLLKDPDAYMKNVVRQWQASSPDAG